MDEHLRISVLIIGVMLSILHINTLRSTPSEKNMQTKLDELEDMRAQLPQQVITGTAVFVNMCRVIPRFIFILGAVVLLSPSPLMIMPLILIPTDMVRTVTSAIDSSRFFMSGAAEAYGIVDTSDTSDTSEETIGRTAKRQAQYVINLVLTGLILGILL